MLLNFTDMLYAFSYALDAVEKEYRDVLDGHGMRVAWMCEKMGRAAGLDADQLVDLTGLAILHDNALVKYLDSSMKNNSDEKAENESAPLTEKNSLRGHCRVGEDWAGMLPFNTKSENVILYHHERADGRGAFGIPAADTPLMAQIIHLADSVDVRFHLGGIKQEDRERIGNYVHAESGKSYTEDAVNLFDQAFTSECIVEAETRGVDFCLRSDVPDNFRDFSWKEICRITGFFAGIIDDKSSFTKRHSLGVARQAEVMARHLGWDEEKTERFYFAGALHDIGKLVVSNDILEKPGKLTGEEFEVMQNHASQTYRVLHHMQGLEDITEWASFHHEKLDGSGYPGGLPASQQSFEDRLMACIDIYQALTEERPYKKGLSHEKTIEIMRDMVQQGKIDAEITEEINEVFHSEQSGQGNMHEGKLDEVPAAGKASVSASHKRWRCPVCGYIYEGDNPPERCPVCDMPGNGYQLLEEQKV
ncbi:MAG: HD domain-containing phosphohydrolase [Eubacterium sp.]